MIAEGTARTSNMDPLVLLSQQDTRHIVERVPGGVSNIQDIYALSPNQESIFFRQVPFNGADSCQWLNPLSFPDRTLLDRYVQAMQHVVDRYDVLRTAFFWEHLPAPVQVVFCHAPLSIAEVTLNPQDGAVHEQLARRFGAQSHPLELTRAPLLRLVIARDPGTNRWLLIEVLHRLIVDQASLEVIHAEVLSFLRGQQAMLHEPQLFRSCVVEARRGPSEQDHERFFKELLADIDEPTFSFGWTKLSHDGEYAHQAPLVLPRTLDERLRTQARQSGFNLSVLCHLAWAVVISRSSNRDAVVFGTAVHASPGNVGPFANSLPIRFDLGVSVQEGLEQLNSRLQGIWDHRYASVALAQRCSGVSADASLFSSQLDYQCNSRLAAEESPPDDPLHGIQRLGALDSTKYPLTLSVEDLGDSLALTAQVPSPLVPERVSTYMRQVLEQLTYALEHAPHTALSQIHVLPPEERSLLLNEWNATDAFFPAQQCIHQFFEQQVERNPDATALAFGQLRLTYSELNAHANRLAHHLIALGARPDDRIALCLERSPTLVIGLLAVLKAGSAYVPLDPAYPSERLAQILSDAAPCMLLCDSAGRSALGVNALERLTTLDPGQPDAPWAQLPHTNPHPTAIGLTARNLAYIIYTSGTTGAPKGVMIEHAQVVRLFEATDGLYHFNSRDVWCLFHSIGFDFSVWELWGALRNGGQLIIVPRDIARSTLDFYRLICLCGVTVLNQTPSAFRALIDAQAQVDLQNRLRYVIFGGEKLETFTLQAWYATHSDQSPVLVNMYGITETTVHATYRVLQSDDASQLISPIGKRLPDLRIYLLDTHGDPVPLGAAGEIYIGGAGVARGYLNRPELTAERFLVDPFSTRPGARMYRTGDLARYLPDQQLEFLGRNDSQVKIRGYRIEPAEIEMHLLSHPAVRQAVVSAREDFPGEKRLVAYLTSSTGNELSPEQLAPTLRAYLSARLPEYMVPAAFARLDALPLTPNGKLDRKALPAPEADAYARRPYEPPQGELEQNLAAFWAELLGISNVSRHDNFFELGGHSLLAARLLSRVASLGATPSLSAVFISPTLRAFASLIQAQLTGRPTSKATLPPAIHTTELPIDTKSEHLPISEFHQTSFKQTSDWMQNTLARMLGRASLNSQLTVRLPRIDPHAISSAFDLAIEGYQPLRTTLQVINNVLLQKVHPPFGAAPIEVIDLCATGNHAEEFARLRYGELHRAFPSSELPRFSIKVANLPENDALIFSYDHSCMDQRALDAFRGALADCYRSIVQGRKPPAFPSIVGTRDFASWESTQIYSDNGHRHFSYWMSVLKRFGVRRYTNFFSDHPSGCITSYRESLEAALKKIPPPIDSYFKANVAGSVLKIVTETTKASAYVTSIRPDVFVALTRFAQNLRVPFSALIISSCNILLSKLTGLDRVMVAVLTDVTAGTPWQDAGGSFLNEVLYPAYCRMDARIDEVVKQTVAHMIEAEGHKIYPLPLLLNGADVSVDSLGTIYLNYVNDESGRPLRTFDPYHVDSDFAAMELNFAVTRFSDGLVIKCQYVTTRFESASIISITNYLIGILDVIAKGGSATIRQIPSHPRYPLKRNEFSGHELY